MCDAQSSRESFCIAETRRQHGFDRTPRRTLVCSFRKEKGPRGLAVQPKSREETPKVGTSWRVGTGHDAVLHMGVFVLRCNLTPAAATELWNAESSGQRPEGAMATCALGAARAQGKKVAEGRKRRAHAPTIVAEFARVGQRACGSLRGGHSAALPPRPGGHQQGFRPAFRSRHRS